MGKAAKVILPVAAFALPFAAPALLGTAAVPGTIGTSIGTHFAEMSTIGRFASGLRMAGAAVSLAAPAPTDYSSYYASVAAYNQRVAENQAVVEKQKIKVAEQKDLLELRRLRGTQLARMGKSGVAGGPTAIAIADDLQDQKERALELFDYERNLADYNATLSGQASEMERSIKTAQNKEQITASKFRKVGAALSAGSSILGIE